MNLTKENCSSDCATKLFFKICSDPTIEQIKNGVHERAVIDSKKLVRFLYSVEEKLVVSKDNLLSIGLGRKIEYLRETIEEVHSLIGGSAPRYLTLNDNFKSVFILLLAQLRNLYEFSKSEEQQNF